MGSVEGVLDRMIMNEIGGKNAAIQAYNGVIWKIRTGFLTLVFAA